MQPWQCYLLIFGIVAVSSAFFYVLFEDPFGCHTESVTERRRREVKNKLEYGYPVGIHIDIGSYNSFNHSMSTLPVSDSFGGWDLQIRLTNKSSRTILRVDTVLTPHAINGDVARSSIGGKSTCMASADGPICSGDFRSYIFQKP